MPTGNFGDIFAGYVALRMGLPVKRLILATNRNDILSRFVNSGVYQALGVHHTISPSMDIQISSNFERYLYYLLDENPDRVRELMEQMAATGSIQVAAEKQQEVAKIFQAEAVSEEETLAADQSHLSSLRLHPRPSHRSGRQGCAGHTRCRVPGHRRSRQVW